MEVVIVKDGKHKTYPCLNVQHAVLHPESPAVKSGLVAPGVEIEITQSAEQNESGRFGSTRMRLPEDGEEAFFVNDAGRTTNRLRWPLPDRGSKGVTP